MNKVNILYDILRLWGIWKQLKRMKSTLNKYLYGYLEYL